MWKRTKVLIKKQALIDEVEAIQEQLLLLIEEEGNTELTEELENEVLTVDELEELFDTLLESISLEEELKETEEKVEV